MAGGLLQLVAYGAQDVYISGNPHITFWKILYKRHTNFAMEAFRVNFTGAPAWGQRVVAVVNRNADLIGRTYVEVELPVVKNSSGVAQPPESIWNDEQNRFGYLLLKQVEVEIGGQIIDRHYGEWLYVWECLTSSPNESLKLDWMVSSNLTTSTATSCGGRPRILYIPLQFWFCRNPGLALPLIALQYHEVRFNITFNDLRNVTRGDLQTSPSTIYSQIPQLFNASLYIDYVYLDTEERRRFAQQSHEYLIEQLQYNEDQSITTASSRIDLTLNHPVKELVWVIQNEKRHDCSGTKTVSPFTYDDIINRGRLQMNGQDRFDERYGDYFWKVQPFQHHSGGWVNLGGTRTIQGTDSTSYPIVSASVVPAAEFVSAGSGAQAPGQLAGLMRNVGGTAPTHGIGFGVYNPINVYSFAIKPEEHQPSGACNFSRIDSATLVFDSVTGLGTQAAGDFGYFPDKNHPFHFRMYAVNYNILRIMSGMGGLAYSN